MERLGGQDQRGPILFRERARRLPEEPRVVRTVQLVSQKRIPQGEQRGPDLMKPSRVRNALHQTQVSVGGQKAEIGFGTLEITGIAGRQLPAEFPFFRHGTLRIGSEKTVSPDPFGEHTVYHGQIGLPNPSFFEERGQHFRRTGRFRKKDKTRGFPVETVDGVNVAVPFPEKCQKRIAEVAARGVNGEIPRFADGQEIGGFVFHGERGIHGRLGQLRFIG